MPFILKNLYGIITNQLGLPITWCYEFVILLIVGAIAFKIAYNTVGAMYNVGLIDGAISGSIVHWTIRVVLFISIWAMLYLVILVVKLF